MVHGRWTLSVNCPVVVERTDMTLLENINKEITGSVSARTHPTLHYEKIKVTYQSTAVHIVCLCSDYINMFNSEYMNNEMIAISNYTNES